MHVSHSEIVYISFLGAEVPFLFQRWRSRCYCGKSEDNKNIYLLIVCALAICNSIQIFLFFNRKSRGSKGIILPPRVARCTFNIHFVPAVKRYVLHPPTRVCIVCWVRPSSWQLLDSHFPCRRYYSSQIVMFIS